MIGAWLCASAVVCPENLRAFFWYGDLSHQPVTPAHHNPVIAPVVQRVVEAPVVPDDPKEIDSPVENVKENIPESKEGGV